jgi:Tol biopolymer transport system component
MRPLRLIGCLFIVLPVYSFFLGSCEIESGGIVLPGKIAVSKTMEHQYTVYINAETSNYTFKFPEDPQIQFSGVDWFNTKEAFIGTETIEGSTVMDKRCNIVEFDSLGKLTRRIYNAEKGELAWPEYTSWDDRYLVFTTHSLADPNIYPFEALAPMVSLVIMDLKHNSVITKIDSIGRMPNFKMEESPWLNSGYRFVFSIDGGTKFKLKNDENVINPVKVEEGIYIYDILSMTSTLLVPGAHSAISSPVQDEIAYEKDNSIRVMEMKSGKEKKIYNLRENEKLRGMHWTPDGRYIYFAYKYHWGIGDMFSSGEKLIEVSSGNEVAFRAIKHGFSSFTWK